MCITVSLVSDVYIQGYYFFLTALVTLHLDPVTRRLAFGQWPLLLFDESRGPCVLVHSTAVNIECLLAIFREGVKNIFLPLAVAHHIK